MNELISKELFCSVMGYPLEEVRNLTELESNSEDGVIYIKFWGRYVGGVKPEHGQCSFKQRYINIYELAHKCKVWAGDLDYVIQTGVRLDGTKEFDVLCIHKNQDIEDDESIYYQDTLEKEPDSIFAACEWLREQL